MKNIINVSTICKSVSSYIKKFYSRNRNIHSLLLNINYKDVNISNFIEVKFKRKKNITRKYIFILQME